MNRNLNPQEFGDLRYLQEAGVDFSEAETQRGFVREFSSPDRAASRPVDFLGEVTDPREQALQASVVAMEERMDGKIHRPDYYGDHSLWAPEVHDDPGSGAAHYLAGVHRRN